MEDRRPLVIAFLLAVIAVGAGAAYYVFGGSADDTRPPEAILELADATDHRAPDVAREAEAAAARGEASSGSVTAASAEATDGGEGDGEPASRSLVAANADSDAGDQATPPPRLTPPSFDIVRVDPSGTAVIAGRGEPGAVAAVLADGAPLAQAEIDDRGEWVVYIEDPLPTGAVELALTMAAADGRELRSDQVVVIAVPETRDERPLVVLGRPGGPSSVLQTPLEDDGLALALLAVDYDDAGGVIFSGRAEPGSRVRVYADRTLLGESRSGDDGGWSLTAGATLPPGVYELQIDQLDADGHVEAVVVAPFERVAPEILAEVGPRTVVVQPGNSLWRIARRLYGSGWQYTVIYAANESQIRNPDLIYPGQVLDLPEGEGDG